jgi:ADP-heptose:LPS heptosyltransferase
MPRGTAFFHTTGEKSGLAYIDDFIAFPGFPGLPEMEPQLERIPEFFARARASRFDLIVQMHGSGALVNPIVVACGARACAGFYRAGEYCPDPLRYMEWPERGTEITRYLRLIEGLGLPMQGDWIDFPLSEADRRSVKTLVPSLEPRRYVCIHCGPSCHRGAGRLSALRGWPRNLLCVVTRLFSPAQRAKPSSWRA